MSQPASVWRNQGITRSYRQVDFPSLRSHEMVSFQHDDQIPPHHCFLAWRVCTVLRSPRSQRTSFSFLRMTKDTEASNAHGHPHLKTPHTNRLRSEGVSFDNFYVSPSCSPTRAALLTGMHEFRNGVTHTIVPRQELREVRFFFPSF